MGRHPLLLSLLLVLPGTACGTTGDDDDSTFDPGCPAEDRFTSDPEVACTENFCGQPVVRLASGASPEAFQLVQPGQEIPIWFGAQGGYHVEAAVEMENLCPVVFVRFGLLRDPGDGTLESIFEQQRHVQSVRVEGGDPPSLQRWWVEQLRFPCAWWPDDPDHDPPCDDAPLGFIEQEDITMRVEAEDHNGRIGVSEVPVQLTCCEG